MTTGRLEVRLGDLCTFQNGGTPSRAVPGYFEGDIPWLTGADITGPAAGLSRSFVSEAGIKASPACVVPPGTVLLVTRTGVGKVAIAERALSFSQDITALHPDSSRLDSGYLVHFLRTQADSFNRKARGATIRGITREVVATTLVPLPPLEEQRRIAAVLDQADDLRAKRKASLALIESLNESVFRSMFDIERTSPVTAALNVPAHPSGWKWEFLTDVARLATGHTPDRTRPEYWNGEIPWISLTEIRELDGRIAEVTELTVTEDGIRNSSSVVLPPGTVCLSRTASIGFVTVMGREMSTSQDFVNWVCGPRLDPIYLMHALLTARKQVRALSTGSTHKTIYMRVAEKFRVLVPPIELQRQFAAVVSDGSRVACVQERSAVELEFLFSSLQQRAFAGQL